MTNKSSKTEQLSTRGAYVRAFLCVGMGHIYLGRWRLGWSLLGSMHLLSSCSFVAWAYGYTSALLLGPLFLLWIAQLVHAGRLAKRDPRTTGEVALAVAAPRRAGSMPGSLLRNTVFFYIAAWVISIVLMRGVIRPHLAEAFEIPQAGMVPTLLPGDHLFTAKLGANYTSPSPGTMVVFRNYPKSDYDIVQRVIAIGGDTVEIKDGVVFVNQMELSRRQCRTPTFRYSDPDKDSGGEHQAFCYMETQPTGSSYAVLYAEQTSTEQMAPLQIPEGHVFMMGDNRDDAWDSREWGPLPVKYIVGIPKRIWLSTSKQGIRWERHGAL